MNFVVNNLTRCAGNKHFTANVTVGARTFDLDFTIDDLQRDFTFDLAKQEMIDRIRSAVKETNAISFGQIRLATLRSFSI